MAAGPIETHLHRSFNWENGAPGPQEGPRGRSSNCGNGLFAQCVRLRSEINLSMIAGANPDPSVLGFLCAGIAALATVVLGAVSCAISTKVYRARNL